MMINKSFLVVVVLLAAVVLVSGCTQGPAPTGCPEDLKTCSDGTTVGRVSPSCNFETCPSAVITDTNLGSDLSNIDTLDADLNDSGLDAIDSDLNAINDALK